MSAQEMGVRISQDTGTVTVVVLESWSFSVKPCSSLTRHGCKQFELLTLNAQFSSRG